MAGTSAEQKAWLQSALGVGAPGGAGQEGELAKVVAAIDARLDWMEEQARDDSQDDEEFGRYQTPGLFDKAIGLASEAYERFNDQLEGKADGSGAAAAERMLSQLTGMASSSNAAASAQLEKARGQAAAQRAELADIADPAMRLKAARIILDRLDGLQGAEQKRVADLQAYQNTASRHLDALEGKGTAKRHTADGVMALLAAGGEATAVLPKIDTEIDRLVGWAGEQVAALEQAAKDYDPPGFLMGELGVLKDAMKGLAQRIAGHDPEAAQQRKLRLEAYEAATKGSQAEGARMLRNETQAVASQLGGLRAMTDATARLKMSRVLLLRLVRMQDVETARAAQMAAYIAAEHDREAVEKKDRAGKGDSGLVDVT